MTPNGQAGTQYPQPLQMSSCTTTVPNSVRNNDPVGQTSRQAASVQCLQTSEDISQRKSVRSAGAAAAPGRSNDGMPNSIGLACSMKATCRQVEAPSAPVLSYEEPSRFSPSSGTPFHSLQATSQALQPMQIEVSVKKPLRGGGSGQPASLATRFASEISRLLMTDPPVVGRFPVCRRRPGG